MMRKYSGHVIIGVGLMMIGTWLIMNDNFFTWPPETVKFANDNVWGSLFIIIGFSLLIWVFDGAKSIKWGRRLLTASAGLMGFLTAYQFIIWAVTGLYHGWIGSLIITAFVLTTARRSDTRNE